MAWFPHLHPPHKLCPISLPQHSLHPGEAPPWELLCPEWSWLCLTSLRPAPSSSPTSSGLLLPTLRLPAVAGLCPGCSMPLQPLSPSPSSSPPRSPCTAAEAAAPARMPRPGWGLLWEEKCLLSSESPVHLWEGRGRLSHRRCPEHSVWKNEGNRTLKVVFTKLFVSVAVFYRTRETYLQQCSLV